MARTRDTAAIKEPVPLPDYNAMVSSARQIFPVKKLTPKYDTWQVQAWDYYDSIGEFEYGVGWLANLLSRVRLVAAEVRDDGEPQEIEDGPAVDAVARLAGGVGGQSQLMKEFTIHLSVPGVCWLVGEEPDPTTDEGPEEETWTVYSADELRVSRRKVRGEPTYEVREEEADQWRVISPNSLVVRCWNPHPRFGWRADSPARHALGALFELDVINKRIIAMILSRLANNGILLYDKTRLSIPGQGAQPNDAEKVDPFAQMLVTVAGRGIADPASPEACIPIPIGFELNELTDVDPKMLMQLIQFSEGVDGSILAQRESAIKRLATSLDLPAEILLGMGDLNHWGAAQIEESAIKVHATPVAELIAYSLTVGYLHPMLKAEGAQLTGPNGGRIVVWYDPSEITAKTDKSGNVIQAYDRFEASGDSLRREIGLEEDDKPTNDEIAARAILTLIKLGNMDALRALVTGEIPEPRPAPGFGAPGEDEGATDTGGEAGGPGEGEEGPSAPPTRGDAPPSEGGRPAAPTRAAARALSSVPTKPPVKRSRAKARA